MSEFEKELESILEKNGEYYQGITTGNVSEISNHFKDWQPPKELVEVPQIVADWFENQLKNNASKKFDGDAVFRIIQDVIKVSNDENTWEDYGITDEIAKFAEDNEELFLNLIVNCSVGNGYTVEKEQMFYLREKNTWYYLTKSKEDSLKLVSNPYFDEDNKFTQSEIDELNIGSYEQISVKVDEVKP